MHVSHIFINDWQAGIRMCVYNECISLIFIVDCELCVLHVSFIFIDDCEQVYMHSPESSRTSPRFISSEMSCHRIAHCLLLMIVSCVYNNAC